MPWRENGEVFHVEHSRMRQACRMRLSAPLAEPRPDIALNLPSSSKGAKPKFLAAKPDLGPRIGLPIQEHTKHKTFHVERFDRTRPGGRGMIRVFHVERFVCSTRPLLKCFWKSGAIDWE